MKPHLGAPISWLIPALLAVLIMTMPSLHAQEARKALSKPQPEYPEIAKKMHLVGVVKIQVVIGANGQIKETKVIGGHPLLVNSTLNTLRGWKFAPAASETTETLEFTFHE